jgi:hypothetical protein
MRKRKHFGAQGCHTVLTEFSAIGSDVVEQRHESEVHVQLLVTME